MRAIETPPPPVPGRWSKNSLHSYKRKSHITTAFREATWAMAGTTSVCVCVLRSKPRAHRKRKKNKRKKIKIKRPHRQMDPSRPPPRERLARHGNRIAERPSGCDSRVRDSPLPPYNRAHSIPRAIIPPLPSSLLLRTGGFVFPSRGMPVLVQSKNLGFVRRARRRGGAPEAPFFAYRGLLFSTAPDACGPQRLMSWKCSERRRNMGRGGLKTKNKKKQTQPIMQQSHGERPHIPSRICPRAMRADG
ncbi:hypothetical protein LY76DRAFT_401456 [Colletotrichum caudatum]|nr:hypothetical protein LY76DRAFT_401456 [Colletotrichum caudatum]